MGCRNALMPANCAASPSFSSMRRSWLYFAIRSVRLAEPVLIWPAPVATARSAMNGRSEEHTSELQSRPHLVCRLLLEKKKKEDDGSSPARRSAAGDG